VALRVVGEGNGYGVGVTPQHNPILNGMLASALIFTMQHSLSLIWRLSSGLKSYYKP
jgi:hypothetical protein